MHPLIPTAALSLALAAGPALADLVLTSPSLGDGQLDPAQVLAGFGCTGGNLSPELSWTGAPEGTAAYVLTLHDPAAPTGSGWWHWVVANLPAGTTALPEGASGALPPGATEVRNDFGQTPYGGACPPEGDAPHPYTLTLYALPALLPEGALQSPAMVSFMARAQALATAELVAHYGR